ncbi:hypothetical protein [Marinobacter salexigens]|uniref:hypothetical protein n=1 Tax=Marinobacter salexigens TaxID=1925763 RepID=UPI00137481D8|nr:hypothetical protein [Marinobacter salexigens]
MIIRTILNFSGLYAAIQLLAVTITHVINLEIPSGAHPFGKAARRHLLKVQTKKASAVV